MEKVSGSNSDQEANQSLILTIRLWHCPEVYASKLTAAKQTLAADEIRLSVSGRLAEKQPSSLVLNNIS